MFSLALQPNESKSTAVESSRVLYVLVWDSIAGPSRQSDCSGRCIINGTRLPTAATGPKWPQSNAREVSVILFEEMCL